MWQRVICELETLSSGILIFKVATTKDDLMDTSDSGVTPTTLATLSASVNIPVNLPTSMDASADTSGKISCF